MSRIGSIFLCVLLSATAAVRAADDWLLTTADLRTECLQGLQIDAEGVHGRAAAGEVAVGWGQFVSVQRNDTGVDNLRPAAFVLLLDHQERLAGAPVGVTGDALVWQEQTLGRVSVPLYRLRALVRSHGINAAEPGIAPKQDVINLVNGDSVAGVFTGCTEQTATVQTDNGATDVPLTSVAKITFAVTAAPPGAYKETQRLLRVRLTDGSIFSAADLRVANGTCSLRVPGQTGPAASFLADDLVSVEAIGGPVVWLAGETPVAVERTPYFGAVDGEPADLEIQPVTGALGAHDLAVHAQSLVRFDVPAGCDSFRTQFAIVDPPQGTSPWADVTVRVRVDERAVYEQAHVHAGPASPVITADVRGAKQITLECDFGESAGVQGRLEWIDPALLRRAGAATRP